MFVLKTYKLLRRFSSKTDVHGTLKSKLRFSFSLEKPILYNLQYSLVFLFFSIFRPVGYTRNMYMYDMVLLIVSQLQFSVVYQKGTI